MTTREKIVVGVMCLTIVYGAYELFGNRRTKSGPSTPVSSNNLEELKSFVADISGKLAGESVSKEYQYMIQKAETGWTKDPFIRSSSPLNKQKTPAIKARQDEGRSPLVKFVYSGFIQMGSTKFAIINGMEYTIGDAVLETSYYVKTITSQQVVLKKVDSPQKISIFISETESW